METNPSKKYYKADEKTITKFQWSFLWEQITPKSKLIVLVQKFQDFNINQTVMKKVRKVLPTNAKVIDVGCGTGRSLSLLSKCFPDSIGIDFSKKSIEMCKNMGLNVLEMDARTMGFPDKSFDLVFEEGMLEHYSNISPFVKEMCRISKKYVLALQPKISHLPVFLRNFYWKFFRNLKDVDEVLDEIPRTIQDYCEEFKKYNFELVKKGTDMLGFLDILLFERLKK